MKKYLLCLSMIALVSCSSGLNKEPRQSTAKNIHYTQSKPLTHNPMAYNKSSLSDEQLFVKATPNISYTKANPNIPDTEDYGVVNIEYQNISIEIYLIDTKAYLSMNVNGQLSANRTEINFNYFYDIDPKSALEQTAWFVNDDNDNNILMLPSFTEEFPTYNILLFNETGLSSSYIIEMRDWACRDVEELVFDKLSRPIKAQTALGKVCQTHIIDEPSI